MQFLTRGTDELAKHSNFRLVGRDEDLHNISSILIRSTANSVLLVGQGGVGCTTICLGLQASKDLPNAALDIVSKRLLWLRSDDLFALGTADKITDAFREIATRLKNTSESVLIIEDARDFIDSARSTGCSGIINSLNAMVKNGETQAILECKDEDIDYVLKAHSDMRQCYTIVNIEEPKADSLLAIAISAARKLEAHHGIVILDEAVKTAIELTTKYRMYSNRAQPERTTNLLDTAAASLRLSSHSGVSDADREAIRRIYTDLRDGEVMIVNLEEEIERQREREKEHRAKHPSSESDSALSSFNSMTTGIDSIEVKSIRGQIVEVQRAVDENRAEYARLTRRINDGISLTRDVVVAEFSRITGISADKLNENEKERLRSLEPNILKRVFGQDEAVHAVCNAVRVARVGRRNGDRPQAAFLFMGPSGVGKTELAKAVAAELLDDESALTRFDMSEFMEKHAVAKLIGAPPGYELADVGGILTNAMRVNPRRVLLFDEIEKAHPDVFNIFLQILSDGRLTDNIGRTVLFGDSIIIMTSNIGQEDLYGRETDWDEAAAEAKAKLDEFFRPELLNRFAGRQNIYVFKILGIDSMVHIVDRELADISRTYGEKGMSVHIDHSVSKQFAEDYYDERMGARGLPGIIQATVESSIATAVLDTDAEESELTVTYGDRHFKVEVDSGRNEG